MPLLQQKYDVKHLNGFIPAIYFVHINTRRISRLGGIIYINRPSVTLLCPMAPTLLRFEQAGIYIVWYWYIVYHNHRISLKDFPTNLLPLLKLKIFKTIILFALSVCYFKCTLVPEAFYEAKETRGENGEPLVTSGPYHQGAVRLIC